MRETRRVSDHKQTPEAPEPERKPAVALDPAPAVAPATPVGGLALGQLGSVEAVIALQQSSGNQAVDRVMRGRADASEALTGALGAALAGTRPAAKPAAPKPAATPARKGSDALGSLLRNSAADRPAPAARAAQSQSPFSVDSGAVAAAAGSGFGAFEGTGFAGPAGFESAVASFGGPGAATGGNRVVAAGGAAGADPSENDGAGAAGVAGVNRGPDNADEDGVDDDEMEADDPGDDDAGEDADSTAEDGAAAETDSASQADPADAPLIRLRARLLGGERMAVDRFAGEDAGSLGWVDLESSRAAHEATRESWVRRQGAQAAPRPDGEQPPAALSFEDPGERGRRADVFRELAGAGVARATGPGQSFLLAADPIGDAHAARARNDATRAQLAAWQGQAGES